ncbi:MAG TPA: cell envelope integrity protein CreD [Spirochaetaceae bacterium]|jgi:inner membrane protein|nr:cell envelope integrity protein CreD [Spirochaetaceae bacterium]
MKAVYRYSGGMGFKVLLMGLLILIMLIPAALVREVIRERSYRADQVEWEILESWGGQLRLAGPVLRIPCVGLEELSIKDDKGRETKELRSYAFDLWVSPTLLETEGALATERKSRGIYSVPVFSGSLRLSGSFDAAEAIASLKPNEKPLMEQAELVLSIANQKGIRSLEPAQWDGRAMAFKPGDSGFGLLSGGVHAAIAHTPGISSAFNMELSIQGGGSVWLLPLGEQSRAGLSADWPAPSYQGNYLPASHGLDEAGFDARWDISYLSHGIPLFWTGGKAIEGKLSQSFFGVDFLKVLDHYALNERAAKYAILFIVVPFLALFMLELFGKRRVHPVQYLLAGIANMVFYLLLLSLSEHIHFNAAYALSAIAVSVMVFLYSWSLFKELAKAWYMVPVMGLSYLYLFITLQSEDWALLIGSLGMFAVLALVMFVTRNVDWYGKGRPPVASVLPEEDA